jgi:hypothetical protein
MDNPVFLLGVLKMKMIGWILAIPFILLALFIGARFLFCGPDKEVISVAKPVMNIIADHIVKEGVPKSLADIKGMPYRLQGCSKKEVYKKNDSNKTIVYLKEKADYVVISEECYFLTKNKLYTLSLWFLEDYSSPEISNGKVEIFNDVTYTGIGTSFRKRNNIYHSDSIGNGYSHYHGILCSSFKQ